MYDKHGLRSMQRTHVHDIHASHVKSSPAHLRVQAQVTKHCVYDERCDIFALGCLLFDLYTRQLRYVKLLRHAAHAGILGQYAVKVSPPFTNPVLGTVPIARVCALHGPERHFHNPVQMRRSYQDTLKRRQRW